MRALAVLAVIGHHIRLPGLSGGFVGVDVFFVISGYLITRILLSDLRAGQFSIGRFYERRVRRILPALLAMFVVTSAAAIVFFFPTALEEYSRTLLSALLSVSNVYFWLHTGYFAPQSGTEALLHTWSLAVEEQFYLIFPVLLYLLHKFSRSKLPVVIAGILIVSLGISIASTWSAPHAAFYLLPSRAWELMIGSLLNLGLFPPMRHSAMRNLASIAGLGMIAGSICFFSDQTPFPGFAAVLPCFGAALLIAAGGNGGSAVNSLLGWSPLVFTGQISYSLYLWHWPLIVFQRTDQILSGNASLARILFLPVLFLISTVSWRYIETPFRQAKKINRATLAAVVLTGSVAVVSIAIAIPLLRGLPARFPAAAVNSEAYLNYDTREPYREGKCFISSTSEKLSPECLQQVPGKRNYLLVGDSHGAHLWAGLNRVYPEIHFMQATGSTCVPVLGAKLLSGYLPHCGGLMDSILHDYLEHTHVDGVVLAADWRLETLPALSATISALKKQGHAVTVVGPIPRYNAPLPHLMAEAIVHHNPEMFRTHLNPDTQDLDARISAIAASLNVSHVSLWHALCKQDRCMTEGGDGAPLQFDTAHLTESGSIAVASSLRKLGYLQ